MMNYLFTILPTYLSILSLEPSIHTLFGINSIILYFFHYYYHYYYEYLFTILPTYLLIPFLEPSIQALFSELILLQFFHHIFFLNFEKEEPQQGVDISFLDRNPFLFFFFFFFFLKFIFFVCIGEKIKKR